MNDKRIKESQDFRDLLLEECDPIIRDLAEYHTIEELFGPMLS